MTTQGLPNNTTISSRLDAEAKVTVRFDPPYLYTPEWSHDDPIFLTSTSFRQADRSIHGRGSGFGAKQDGSMGKAVRHAYTLSLSALPDDVAAEVKRLLAAQLARVTPEGVSV